MNFVWPISFFADCLVALLFFRQNTRSFHNRRLWLKLLLLLLLLPLYSDVLFLNFPYPIVRLPVRAVLYFLFFLWTENSSILTSVYAALFWAAVSMIFNNFFFVPYLHDFSIASARVLPSPLWNQVLLSGTAFAVRLIFFGAISMLFPFKGMDGARLPQIGFMAIVCFVTMYMQSIGVGTQPVLELSFSLHYILLHVALLLFMLAFEYARRHALEKADVIRQQTAVQALLENLHSRQQSEETLRALRHDLKNHVIAMRFLLEQGKTERVMQYLDTFEEEAAVPIGTFHTGNDLLDCLLQHKLSPALKQGIKVEVALNFLRGEFLAPFDLCVLLGNTLDHAIEECLRMPTQDGCFIKVSGGPFANCMLIRVENSCQTDEEKEDAFVQGYGLRNMQRVLQRYDGNLTVTTEEAGRFTLTMLIPIP